MFRVTGTLLLLLSVTSVDQSPRLVPIILEGPEARCELRGAPLARVETQAVLVDCSRPSDVIRCDGEGMEPLDFLVQSACAARRLGFTAAAGVTLRSAGGAGVTLEWIDASIGERPHVLARRDIVGRVPQMIWVGHQPGRLLRASRRGDSPATISANTIHRNGYWEIPGSVDGGELVLVRGASFNNPVRYEIRGPINVWAQFDSGQQVVSVRGIPAGLYVARAVYASGIFGRPHRASVAEDSSTLLPVIPEALGGAIITAPPELCRTALRFMLSPLTDRDAIPSDVFGENQKLSADIGNCAWNMSELRPGPYEAALLDVSGSVAVQRFRVERDVWVSITLSAPEVHVFGTITVDGAPLNDARVSISVGTGSIAARTTSDAAGWYSLRLAEEGEYFVGLTHPDGYLETKTVKLRVGDNNVDWRLAGTSLTVHVEGGVIEDVKVTLRRLDSSDFFSVKAPSDGFRAVKWAGLPSGRYSVTARSGPLSSQSELFELDSGPKRSVVIQLRIR